MELWDVKEVAEYLQCHPLTIYRLLKTGQLPGLKLGGRWRVPKEGLSNWMDQKMGAGIKMRLGA